MWYNSWLNAPGNHSWQEFANGMHRRFGCAHSALSIARMWDNLKQEGFVEDYIKAHEKIWQLSDNQVQANQGFVGHTFIQNLKPGLAKFIWDKDCETIKDTYQEARNAKQKAKFTSRPNNGNNNGQSNNFNSCRGNNYNKCKKFTNNSYTNNCRHQPKEKGKYKSKGNGAC